MLSTMKTPFGLMRMRRNRLSRPFEFLGDVAILKTKTNPSEFILLI
jgi:hypothetical protein